MIPIPVLAACVACCVVLPFASSNPIQLIGAFVALAGAVGRDPVYTGLGIALAALCTPWGRRKDGGDGGATGGQHKHA